MNNLLNLDIDEKTLKVSNREREHREFKSQFENDSLWKYAKTIAAFANRDGGVIFFGVKNSPREIIGVNSSEPDELVFANFVKEYFEPEITFEFDSKIYAGKKLLYILVQSSTNKPVVCKKKKIQQFKEKGIPDKELLREGAIYYRYSSASEEIKYPELKKILDDRVQSIFNSLVQNITLINKVGFDKAAIVDAAELSGNDRTTSVYITTETAKKINWIRKGRFSESDKEGEKAFYVTREIEVRHGVEIEKPIDPGKTHKLTKTALSKETSMSNQYLDAVLWKLGLADNPRFHLTGKHGKSTWHKFTESCKDKIHASYPLYMESRNVQIKQVFDEYDQSKKAV